MKAPLLTTWLCCGVLSVIIFLITYPGSIDGVTIFMTCVPLVFGFVITMAMNHITAAILSVMVLLGLYGIVVLLALKGSWSLFLVCVTLASPLIFLIPLKVVSEFFDREKHKKLCFLLDVTGSILVIVPVVLSFLFSLYAIYSDLSAGVLNNIIGLGIYLYICSMYFALAVANCESKGSAFGFIVPMSSAMVTLIMGIVLNIIH